MKPDYSWSSTLVTNVRLASPTLAVTSSTPPPGRPMWSLHAGCSVSIRYLGRNRQPRPVQTAPADGEVAFYALAPPEGPLHRQAPIVSNLAGSASFEYDDTVDPKRGEDLAVPQVLRRVGLPGRRLPIGRRRGAACLATGIVWGGRWG